MKGIITVVSTGPGDICWLSSIVTEALEKADVMVGYKTYLDLIETIRPEIPRECSGMRQETGRAGRAVELALSGKNVAVISGGDAGIYGMAGLVLEKVYQSGLENEIEVVILPGISALNAASSLLGAPLMNDFAVISLSDYLMSLDTILTRVTAAVRSGFVLCIYNPKSYTRVEPFNKALKILQEYLNPDTPVGIVKNAFRSEQDVRCVPLCELGQQEILMNCILIVGNNTTKMLGSRMVTPRGYDLNKSDNSKEPE
ncbi:MAG: precorrin-3B C(17)-methyltransferase [Flexilinea sp.]